MDLPFLVFSDKKGKIYHHSELRMVASSFDQLILPCKNELIKLPKGSSLFYLPNRYPVGIDPKTREINVLEDFQGKEVFAVSAFTIPAYLRLYNPAASIKKKRKLPLWAYSACGYLKGNFYISAKRVDNRVRQSPRFYDNNKIKRATKQILKKHPKNRLYRHLSNCALNYNCLAAKNLFLKRWEAPLPTARSCNARCVGCLSHQDSDCVSSHQRINFKPRIDEIVEVMKNHLKGAKEAIVSFGQGCEGEPLAEAETIVKSIVKVREGISRGTINMNTNASDPKKIKKLCLAGIDSFRVSLNSPTKEYYNRYFRPIDYKFKDVLKSIEVAKKYNKFVSINLFIFPGFSDSIGQIKGLIKLIKDTGVDMIQWRNLNIDPETYIEIINDKKLKPQGVLSLLSIVRKEFPKLKQGYFNLPKENF